MNEKLRYYFSDMIVYKDLKKSNTFATLPLPAFMRDWLLQRFSDADGELDVERVKDFVSRRLPHRDEWNRIKDKLVNQGEHVEILAKARVNINVSTSETTFELPDYDLKSSETTIEPCDWEKFNESLLTGRESWGICKLRYRLPKDKPKTPGKIKLVDFKPFCPYEIDLDFYKDARSNFDVKEWIDVLLGAIDYNADGFQNSQEKLTMLTRLLPFVEKRLNLIELAPKGTGKTTVYGRLSRYGWLSSGNKLTRAQLLYNVRTGEEGLLTSNDYLVLDEIQSQEFSDSDEIVGGLKNYMEQGVCTVAGREIKGDTSVVLSGNIAKELMDKDGYANMFGDLPEFTQQTAFLERFHGFIRGWNLPRINENLKISGWALNSEYFTTILHELRSDLDYRQIVDEIVIAPHNADTRHLEAMKRIATAYLKLLFPHVREARDVDAREFEQYCLRPASKMRSIILYQMGLLDNEYEGKDVPEVKIDREKCRAEED